MSAAEPRGSSDLLVRAVGLEKSFGKRKILDGVDVHVKRGETLVVMGSSGHGKSTILRILVGLLEPDAGEVELFGQEFLRADEETRDSMRKRFGILFQSGALYSSMTVGENIATPLREHAKLPEETIRTLVKMKLELVGLRDALTLMPAQLSGGMKKRVGLARAVALDPELLFCDEPTAGLDPIATAAIDEVINSVSSVLGMASVVVTHDMASAFRIADRMIMLFRGKVIFEGTPDQVRESDDPAVIQFVEGLTEGPIPLRLSAKDYAADLLDDDDEVF